MLLKIAERPKWPRFTYVTTSVAVTLNSSHSMGYVIGREFKIFAMPMYFILTSLVSRSCARPYLAAGWRVKACCMYDDSL